MQVQAYLDRMGYRGSLEPNLQNLQALHQAHMLNVPFENLDIHLGRPIILELPLLYDKIVNQRRGGFCYELNGLFAWLLEELGYPVQRFQAGVFGRDGKQGPDFDHMLLKIELDEPVIADVGFGDSFIQPIAFDGTPSLQRGVAYRIQTVENGYHMQSRKPTEAWAAQYAFTGQPQELGAYEAMCHYQQTSPESNFTKKTVCSLATPDGRVTVSNGRLIRTIGENKKEEPIHDDDTYRALLKDLFNFKDVESLDVSRLMNASEMA